MTHEQAKSQQETSFEVVSDVVKVSQASSKMAGLAGQTAGAAHHAGMAVGGGASSGFFAGKAAGFKLGLGLGGFGGPVLLAAVCGAGGYALYRWARNRAIPHTDKLIER